MQASSFVLVWLAETSRLSSQTTRLKANTLCRRSWGPQCIALLQRKPSQLSEHKYPSALQQQACMLWRGSVGFGRVRQPYMQL
eukprot:1157843-Pelagomonas_calceolata.AAC.9